MTRNKLYFVLPLGALLLAASPQSCTQITPEDQALIQSDLDTFCPVLGAIDPSIRQVGNGNVVKALNTIELACPPNPPPTNWVVIGVDLLDAVTVIQPYVNKYLKTHHVRL